MSHHSYNLRSKSKKLEHDRNPPVLPFELRGAEIIPQEVRDAEILARLPPKDLMLYRVVCKSWSSLTGKPDFVSAYRKFNKKTHLLFLVWEPNTNQQQFFSVQTTPAGITDPTPATNVMAVPLPPLKFPFTTHVRGAKGLMLVHNAYCTPTSEEHDMSYVINPCTRKYYKLPRDMYGRSHCMYHFGFCTSGNNEYYKVLQVEKTPDGKCAFNIFTLGSTPRTWRSIYSNNFIDALPFDMSTRSFAESNSSVCVDGIIYWTQRRMTATSNPMPHETYSLMEFDTAETMIVAFCVEAETFSEVPPPRPNGVKFNKIVDVCGCVALLHVIDNEIELWILKVDSRNHRWVNKTILASFMVMGVGPRLLYKLLTGGKFIFLRGNDMIMYVYDVENQKLVQVSDVIWPQWLPGISDELRLVEFYDDTIVTFERN